MFIGEKERTKRSKLHTIVVRDFLIIGIIFLATYWLCGFLLNEEKKFKQFNLSAPL